jgi:hypothetical protein
VIELHAFLERPWRNADVRFDPPGHPSELVERVAALLCHRPRPARAGARLYRAG